MSRLLALSLSMALLLMAFPLISVGTTGGPGYLWPLGLACLVAGGIIPPVQRFMTKPKPEAPTRAGFAEDERV